MPLMLLPDRDRGVGVHKHNQLFEEYMKQLARNSLYQEQDPDHGMGVYFISIFTISPLQSSRNHVER